MSVVVVMVLAIIVGVYNGQRRRKKGGWKVEIHYGSVAD